MCMQLPSTAINNAFNVQPSEELTKEASYKEKSILQSSQEKSGEEIGRLTIFMPHLIYVKRAFTFQKAFSMGLVPRFVFGGLESTLGILKYFRFSGILLTCTKELHKRLPGPQRTVSLHLRCHWYLRSGRTHSVSLLPLWWLRYQTTKLKRVQGIYWFQRGTISLT